ncbi:MAG: hypothetical protein M1817_005894 [Caeruleum heppii]|nr:MAG: hypothetical protein M1817_005894 [Caeruleum heppii]
MLKYEEATPCPAVAQAPTPWLGSRPVPRSRRPPSTTFAFVGPQRSDSGDLWSPGGSDQDGDTQNVEYTTEWRASLRNQKPRRRRTLAPRGEEVAIFEDASTEGGQDQQQIHVSQGGRRDYQTAGTSLLVAPARSKRLSMAPVTDTHDQQAGHQTVFDRGSQRLANVSGPAQPRRRRISSLLAERESTALLHPVEEDSQHATAVPQAKKESRRRTIYVPSDDTTIMTIHPGASLNDQQRVARQPARNVSLFDLATVSEEPSSAHQPTSLSRPKVARKSLAAAPRRVPMLQVSRPVQGFTYAPDRRGNGRGKENIPPGGIEAGMEGVGKKTGLGNANDAVGKPRRVFNVEMTEKLMGPAHKGSTEKRSTGTIAHKRTISGTTIDCAGKEHARGVLHPPPVATDLVTVNDPHKYSTTQASRPLKLPTKLSVPMVDLDHDAVAKFPVLSEEIPHPEMYEDNWLAHQEAAITQLLNRLFESAHHPSTPSDAGIDDGKAFRQKLLHLYTEAPFPLLHKRLQASVLYGALSLPRESLGSALRYRDDLGLRRRFLDLWIGTFDLAALKTAAEIVIGRQMDFHQRLSNGKPSPLGTGEGRSLRREQKMVEEFLDAFLVKNEDAPRAMGTTGSIGSIARNNFDSLASNNRGICSVQASQWRRTLLRSLMMIHLLDHAKSTGAIQACLFRPSSPHKSTIGVLHALSNILMPSHGDIIRSLSHLDYHVHHTQYPLQEYQYQIENLATDIRDGVRLTRLVELLLYPPSSLVCQQVDVTITMPTGEVLTSCMGNDQGSWVLSQHLKFPALGRATKLYNTQLALASLEGVSSGTANVAGVKAEDLVNGHREKTVGLLWGLVSRWGMSSLVDWNELEREIRRLKAAHRVQRAGASRHIGHSSDQEDAETEDDDDDEDELEQLSGLERHSHLLKCWSSIIARRHSLRVANLSTSFADGRVLEAIVKEYEQYLPSAPPTASAAFGEEGLELKLRRLGCSNYFGLTEGTSRVYDYPGNSPSPDPTSDPCKNRPFKARP